MNDFAKLLGRFVARDFIYFLGGTYIITAFLIGFLYPQTPEKIFEQAGNIPVVLFAPLAAVAYIIGYLVNLIFGLVGFNSPADRLIPWTAVHSWRGKLAKALFYLLNRYPLEDLAKFIDKRPSIKTYKDITPAHVYALQALDARENYLSRTTTLHHFSSVIGSSLLLTSAVFFYCSFQTQTSYLRPASFVTFLASLILCWDSNYRSFQIAFCRMMLAKWRPRTRDDDGT